MNQVIGDLLPMALAVLISPIPIVAEILLLFSDRPKPNATAYVLGFLLGVALALGLLTLLAGTQDLTADSGTNSGVAWLKVGLGALLVIGGIRRLRNRSSTEESETPKWMQGIESFHPGRSFVVGLGIGALNPKNIIVGLAGALIIAAASLSSTEAVGSIVAYAAFASLGVLAPLVVAIAMGSRSDELLKGWRTWLVDNNASVVAVILVVIGVVLIGKGIGAT